MIERFMTKSEIEQNEYIIINNNISSMRNRRSIDEDVYYPAGYNRFIDEKITAKKFVNKQQTPKKKKIIIVKFNYNL